MEYALQAFLDAADVLECRLALGVPAREPDLDCRDNRGRAAAIALNPTRRARHSSARRVQLRSQSSRRTTTIDLHFCTCSRRRSL